MEIKEIIIQGLKDGLSQSEISLKLIEQGLKPNSLSSVEKYLNALKKDYGAKTMFQLGYVIYQLDFQTQKAALT